MEVRPVAEASEPFCYLNCFLGTFCLYFSRFWLSTIAPHGSGWLVGFSLATRCVASFVYLTFCSATNFVRLFWRYCFTLYKDIKILIYGRLSWIFFKCSLMVSILRKTKRIRLLLERREEDKHISKSYLVYLTRTRVTNNYLNITL